MLIEFSIENFRSVKKEITLSMISTKDSSLGNNLIETGVLKEDKLLKSAVIYGANASGKTNILFALHFLKLLVMNSHKHQKGQGIRFTPFKLDKESKSKPTRFKIVFIKNGVKYLYGLSFDKNKIINEYLYFFPNNRQSLIFDRKNTGDYRFTLNKKDQGFISKRTLDNVLYLSKSTQENYKETSVAFDWFKDDLQVIGPTDHPSLTGFTANLLRKDKSLKKIILKALLEADVGIEDVNAIIKKISADSLPKNIPPEIKKMIMHDKKEVEGMQIQTVHKGVLFDFEDEESEGTVRIFSLIGPWIEALRKGQILVVDELDTKLHHFLNVFLINLFHDPTQNKNNAQLIFTTHNTNLLDQEIFRRDQIWFTEKRDNGSTDLYSLMEYSPRKDKNIEKGYLAGRYGAIPFIKENKIF